ncbi:MAG: TfoX/Sxy family transcriptional regulator of competence genes [Planctomycetota bacterium]|jgi:TfoX/Sxy family transcriptional regulator of competence genes
MATSKDTIEYLLGQLDPLNVRARAMFGGHCLYCDEKVVLLVTDDQTFLKSSPVTDSLGLDCEMAPPYPGAKETLLLHDRILQDPSEFKRIVQATADALPKPKPKKKKAAKKKATKKKPKRA